MGYFLTFISTNQVKNTLSGAAKMEIFTRFIEVKVFLKESLKCTEIYIVGVVRGF